LNESRRTTPERIMRRRRRAAVAAFVAAVAAIALFFVLDREATQLARPGKPPLGYLREPLGERTYRVTAWTLGDGDSLVDATAGGAVDEVDFDWYQSQEDGSVAARAENLDLVAAARNSGLNIFATVTNQPAGRLGFSRDIAAAIMATPDSRRRHIENLVALVKQKGFDGIDLDWEALKGKDRQPFAAFVEELGAALHAEGRFLSLAVFPKTQKQGRWDSQIAMDYRRLGAAVDEFKVMAYNFSGPWSDPGPQAPLAWADKVLSFAESQVPPGKVYLGIPFYGYDWHAGKTTAVRSNGASEAAARYGVKVGRDAASGEATLHYTDGEGVAHVVYYQDEKAIAAKLDQLRGKHPRIAGIAVWVMGQEDPAFWTVIAHGLR
jgi:spore germination protein YaaH